MLDYMGAGWYMEYDLRWRAYKFRRDDFGGGMIAVELIEDQRSYEIQKIMDLAIEEYLTGSTP